ncbi:MAG TPA: M23 family metallopeptidase [Saprospiraceae bacterium]|nr:M23 family metallopeptidase [Saprospiraceae bacterium]HPK10364.1 M23 family metallopeptidase [Saprospiraceae bacterium]HPQ21194.1 M23 family metallopeptidase [Saprospiraceae bacterium]
MENLTKKNFKRNLLDFAYAIVLAGVIFAGYKYLENKAASSVVIPEATTKRSNIKFGFNLDSLYIESNVIQQSDLMGDILYAQGINYQTIAALENKAKDIFSVRKIRSGKKYHLIKEDECGDVLAMVYEPNSIQYVVFDLRDSVNVDLVDKHVDVCQDIVTGEVETSLWESLENQNVSYHIIDLMENALSGSVDFYHVQQGDKYKLIYEKKYVDGKSVGLGKVLGAYFSNQQGEHYSYYFSDDKLSGYYDSEGRPNQGTFLMAPIKSSYRVSSGYNLKRFHPIKKVRIPHLGTDYAAPYGTPIISVADGVVEKAGYTANNGRYVKIRHDKTYETQYLHMQRFGNGIRSGVRVKQGQVIGYVGSTGLATGPHVCFRFWKNGRQVDHRREIFPPSPPMPESELPKFFEVRDNMKSLLDQIQIQSNDNQKSTYNT